MSAAARGPAQLQLRELAENEGTSWATSALASLSRDGRDAIGGWPGTMSEARLRIGSRLAPFRAAMSQPAGEELARVAYHAARRYWQSHALREPAT